MFLVQTMGKKQKFVKTLNRTGLKKDPFKVADSQHKKKAKAVKTNIKQVNSMSLSSMNRFQLTVTPVPLSLCLQIQAKVKAQQESSDKNLQKLHEHMVVKKPAASKKPINLNSKKVKKAGPNTGKVQDDLKKMNVD